ncbi:MAG: hypothetical protein ACYDH4_11635 [Candidatus Cryosericum sp.]
MEAELSQQANVQPQACEDKHNRKTLAMTLSLTSLGFLVLEGLVCLFSQRTDPWHGHPWFALVVLLGAALVVITTFHSSLCVWAASFLRNALGILYAAQVFMALIFAAGLWSVGQDLTRDHVGSIVLIAIVDCFIAGRTLFLDRQSLAAVDNRTESSNETRQSPPQGLSPALVASLSFALLIVLSFAWSCASSFTYYLTTKTAFLSYLTPADLNKRILGDCAGEAMARLFLLAVLHAGVLLVLHIRARSVRAIVLACVLALGAWGYCWVMTQSAVGYARIWYGQPNGTPQLLCAAWIVPLILPFAYVQYLSRSIHATLVSNTIDVVEQTKKP